MCRGDCPPKTDNPAPRRAGTRDTAQAAPARRLSHLSEPGKGHTSTFPVKDVPIPPPVPPKQLCVPMGRLTARCGLPLASRLTGMSAPPPPRKEAQPRSVRAPGALGCLHVSPWVLQGTRNAIGAVRVHDAGGFGAAALLPACVCLRLVQLPAGEPRTFAPHSLEDSRGAMGAATPAHEARDKGQGLCLHMHSRTLTPAQGFHTAPPNTEPELTAFPKGRRVRLAKQHGLLLTPPPRHPDPDGS